MEFSPFFVVKEIDGYKIIEKDDNKAHNYEN